LTGRGRPPSQGSRRSGIAARLALGVMLLAGCNPAAGPAPGSQAAGREPLEQSFGPDYSVQRPAGSPTRVHRASLSADRRTLTVTFVGGKGYLAADPCSTDYEPWVAAHDDELDLVVVQISHPDQAKLGLNQACTLEGYGWTFHLALPRPFMGTTINDLASGGRLLVGPLPDTAHVTALPPGWSLQAAWELDPGPPPIWVEIYGAEPIDPNGDEGPGRLVLYQSFGIIGEWTDTRAAKSDQRGGVPVPVTFQGSAATVWVDASSGELLLAWDASGRSYGLIGNLADMTVDDLVTFAGSVAIPD
jgi:hypothetical protein